MATPALDFVHPKTTPEKAIRKLRYKIELHELILCQIRAVSKKSWSDYDVAKCSPTTLAYDMTVLRKSIVNAAEMLETETNKLMYDKKRLETLLNKYPDVVI